jgi:hypothetical protein
MELPVSVAIEGLMGDVVTADMNVAAEMDLGLGRLRRSQAECGGGDAGEVSQTGRSMPGHLK